ncbi:hypothetical protein PZT57_26555 [Pseudomonas aeruginosa]|uniref:hypothetical protein n=1 Tax=Pseudomonas aeruginosa TaxID=287 RepID=UPI002B26F9CD|nr:hypothetical protein [Pseudomonas aeruginosa]MEA8592211.1 hypothetical protein [Pseudomonas aeruginosa]
MKAVVGFLENLLTQLRPPQQLEAATQETTLAESFQEPVSALANRAGALLRFAVLSGGVALVAGLVALICYTVGWSHLPTSAIDQIVIPEHAAGFFAPEAVTHGGGRTGGGLGGLSGATATFGNVNDMLYDIATGWLLRGVGIAALLFGIVNAFMRQNVMPLFMAVPLLIAPSLLGTMLETSDPDLSSRDVPTENKLLVAAEDKDYLTIKKLLGEKTDIDDFTKVFILSQAAIAANVHEPKVLLEMTKELRSSAWANLKRDTRSGKPGFSIDPQVAYALETAADGTVSNRKAVEYEKAALRNSATWKSAGWLAALAAVFFGVMAVGPLSLSQVISLRLKRLQVLFSQAD